MNRLKYLLPVMLWLASHNLYAGALEDGAAAFNAQDYAQARKLWLPLATGSDADAQYNMGLLYMKGLGVKKQPRIAIQWFKRAAYYGSVDAAYNLGVMYQTGQGVYPSDKDAIYWWQQAADTGHAESQYNLAVMYAYGYGIQQDVPTAIRYWEKAAQQGQPESRQLLLKIYTEGLLGIKPDAEKARQWK